MDELKFISRFVENRYFTIEHRLRTDLGDLGNLGNLGNLGDLGDRPPRRPHRTFWKAWNISIERAHTDEWRLVSKPSTWFRVFGRALMVLGRDHRGSMTTFLNSRKPSQGCSIDILVDCSIETRVILPFLARNPPTKHRSVQHFVLFYTIRNIASEISRGGKVA